MNRILEIINTHLIGSEFQYFHQIFSIIDINYHHKYEQILLCTTHTMPLFFYYKKGLQMTKPIKVYTTYIRTMINLCCCIIIIWSLPIMTRIHMIFLIIINFTFQDCYYLVFECLEEGISHFCIHLNFSKISTSTHVK